MRDERHTVRAVCGRDRHLETTQTKIHHSTKIMDQGPDVWEEAEAKGRVLSVSSED